MQEHSLRKLESDGICKLWFINLGVNQGGEGTVRVSQQKQEMEITWKFSSWGSATKCHLCCPVRSSRAAGSHLAVPRTRLYISKVTVLVPSTGVRGANPQAGLPKHGLSLISMSWCHPQLGSGVVLHKGTWLSLGTPLGRTCTGPFTPNTARNKKEKGLD